MVPASTSAPTSTTSGKPLPEFLDLMVFEGDNSMLDLWLYQTCMYLFAFDVDVDSVRSVGRVRMFLRGPFPDWIT